MFDKFGGIVLENIMQRFWSHQIFIATKDDMDVQVIGVQQALCSNVDFKTKPMNRFAFIGKMQDLHTSPNGQHLFATISRREWELKSVSRYLDICARLEKTPDDVFLKSYRDPCINQPPRPLDLNQYAQQVSSCMSGSHCPSLNDNQMNTVKDGYYTIRPNELNICEKNYFCKGGSRIECPQGFVCPYQGMTSPLKCDQDDRGEFSCAQPKLDRPLKCPNGTECIAPYYPPLPINHGYYVQLPQNELIKCEIGEWCPLGRSVHNRSELQCPANFFCEHPGVIEPILCSCNKTRCSFCPEGTSVMRDCPKGFYCIRPDTIKECDMTQYCPAGSLISKPCSAGFYCPTPSEQLICPYGHSCPEGTVKPIKCPLFVMCQEGTKADQPILLGVIIDLLIIVVIIAAYVTYILVRNVLRKRDKLKKRSVASPCYGTPIYDASPSSCVEVSNESSNKIESNFSMSIEFVRLNLQVGSVNIIEKLSGHIRPGRLTAIMGLSGSGKTSLINILAGRAFYGNVTGDIYINGRRDDLKYHRSLVGYVPQDDIMLRTMTVQGTLNYAAKFRLDSSKTSQQVEDIVERAIHVLGLEDVRHSIIGDEKNRGISGGQRKRVNVAMELVADPCVLFLDEPTSGLDSSGSKELCSALRQIAESGITTITVIHQPRHEIFQLFHDVILLGKGGNPVYFGPSHLAMKYFTSLGFECPEHINPSDWMMDIISGDVPRKNDVNFKKEDLFDMWKFSSHDYVPSSQEEDDGYVMVEEKQPDLKQEHKKRRRNFFYILYSMIKRNLLQQVRDLSGLFLDNVLVYIAGLCLGMIFYNQYYIGPPPKEVINMCPDDMKQLCRLPIDDPLINQASLVPLSMGLCAIMSSLSAFGDESLVFHREYLSGVSPFAYFLAKNLAQIPRIAITPLIFLSIYFTMYSPRGNVFEYYLILLLCHFTAYGFGYFISIAIRPSLAQIAAVVMILVFQLIAGARPTLPQMYKMPFPLPFIPYLSYIRYGQEALYLLEVKWYKDIYDIKPGLDLFDYDEAHYAWCIAVVPVFGIVIRMIAFFFLYSNGARIYIKQGVEKCLFQSH
ncbi:ABCG24 [Acrasis kona]|uniref:ABCG24 n=1 Tax=Acrasis kona TaxID=1008807 RepID=A0AAW2YTH4_9EUKA